MSTAKNNAASDDKMITLCKYCAEQTRHEELLSLSLSVSVHVHAQ